MPPTALRIYLPLLALAGPALLIVALGLADWLGPPLFAGDVTWQLTLSFFAAICIPSVLVWFVTRKVRLALDAAEQAVAVGRSREAALRTSSRTKDEFLAMLGHELRNPLAALAAAVHVLRRTTAKDDTMLKAIDVLGRQVQHMSRLTEDLLDVNRVTRGKVSLNRQPLDFSRVVEKAVGELKHSGRLERHELRLDLSPVWVRADEARIEQIVANLVGNAVKYTPERGLIEVTLRRDRNTAVLRVRDSGIGMSADLVSKVFDLFVQGEAPGRQAGLGIGLTLVRHLAELHAGKAFAASAGPGEGSVFTVTLPAIEAQPGVQLSEPAAARHTRHRILLVEDNVDARSTMFEALQLDGHHVFEANDGESGIRAAAAVQPDVAIIDIGLPGRDGYEVASALRQTLEHPEMVLIAVTGYEQPDSLRRAREAGFDEYVTKPIAPDRLVRLIDAALAARTRRHQDPQQRPNAQ